VQRKTKKNLAAALALAGIASAVAFAAPARAETMPRLYLNQTYAENAMRETTLKVEDPMAVFKFVLGSLPDRVKVYPTENYFYFSFFQPATSASTSPTATRARCTSPITRIWRNGPITMNRSPTACSTPRLA
jgi:hypothetical protein